jgi:hypothetical protein
LAGFSLERRLSQQKMQRQEASEHPFVQQAKQFAKETGTSDNATINWAVKLLEDSLAFGNQRR